MPDSGTVRPWQGLTGAGLAGITYHLVSTGRDANHFAGDFLQTISNTITDGIFHISRIPSRFMIREKLVFSTDAPSTRYLRHRSSAPSSKKYILEAIMMDKSGHSYECDTDRNTCQKAGHASIPKKRRLRPHCTSLSKQNHHALLTLTIHDNP